MRVLATMLTTAVILAAGSVQAAPGYKAEAVSVFKKVCLQAGPDAAAVAGYAQKLGWTPANAKTKVWWHGAATKVWLSPATPRLYLAQSPEGGYCEVGWFGGSQSAIPDPAAFDAMMKAAMNQGGAALGLGFVKVAEPQGLLSQQGVYKSPSYPALKVYVVVANMPEAPTFNLVSAKP